MCNVSPALSCLGLLWAISLSVASADDWPHWRGPSRDDRVAEDSGWDAGGWPLAKPAWNVNVGEGGTSPLVVGDRLYVLGWNDGNDKLSCLDTKDGKEIWSASYPCPQHGRKATGDEGLYSGPTSTPEYDALTGLLYTLSCDGDLICWDTHQRGRQVWKLNLYEKFDVPQRPRHGRSGLRDYGYTTAPLLIGEWLVVEVGAKAGNLVAFSRQSGETAWTSQYTGPAGHTGGIARLEIEGVPCLAVLTYEGLHVARLDKAQLGKTVALYPWETDFANNVAMPAVFASDVLITSSYNHNAICRLHLTLAGATKVWEQPYASKICSPIIDRGRVYWAWQSLHCLDFESGRQLWEGGQFGDAGSCILTSDGRLIVWGGHGRLALVDAKDSDTVKYQELARGDKVFDSDVWPHVTLARGRLYCKDRLGNLKCFVLPTSAKP